MEKQRSLFPDYDPYSAERQQEKNYPKKEKQRSLFPDYDPNMIEQKQETESKPYEPFSYNLSSIAKSSPPASDKKLEAKCSDETSLEESKSGCLHKIFSFILGSVVTFSGVFACTRSCALYYCDTKDEIEHMKGEYLTLQYLTDVFLNNQQTETDEKNKLNTSSEEYHEKQDN